MLQETLEKSTYSPAELANMVSSFVESELPAGGASAEKAFFELFPTLCDRVFGVISPTDYKHEIGGWMSRDRRWEYGPTSSSNKSSGRRPHLSPMKSTKAPSIHSDPVVLLLGTRKKTSSSKEQNALILIDAFAKEAEHRQNVRYDFQFLALPKSLQNDWLAVIQTSLGAILRPNDGPSVNSCRLFGSLFRATPREQVNLLMYQQSKTDKKTEIQRRPLQLNPMFSSPNTARSPSLPITALDTVGKPKGDSPPKALLSMLEYYLLVFVRYPLASPESKSTTSTSTSSHRIGIGISPRKAKPYGECVYDELFKEYVAYYVPIRSSRGPFEGFSSLKRPSELFARLIAALWLESRNRLDKTSKVSENLKNHKDPVISLDLCASFDLVKGVYEELPRLISDCVSQLVIRVVIDATIANISERISRDYSGREDKLLCLSPTMGILQLPFYNHIRNVFRNAPLHSRKDLTFYSALDDWLVWLEPWNTHYSSLVKSAVPRVSKEKVFTAHKYATPKFSHSSKYSPIWESYIASNLHFYTVPLALFVRRARELDFSQGQYTKSLHLVMRVLRVYNQDVVAVINRLLNVRANGAADALLKSDAPYSTMILNHEKNLGPYAPPDVCLSLSSLQGDVELLLDEIYRQQRDNVDKANPFEKWVDSTFGAGTQHKEEKYLQILTEKARTIFGFPKDFQVSIAHKSLANNQQEMIGSKTRTSQGFYSDVGRDELARGGIKCRPEEVVYVGDRMKARPQSYEIGFLVPILINLSINLNNRFGFEVQPKTSKNFLGIHRINLRFLADCRNLGFIALVLWWLIK